MSVRSVLPKYVGTSAKKGGAGTAWLRTENRSVVPVESSAFDPAWCRYPQTDLSLLEL